MDPVVDFTKNPLEEEVKPDKKAQATSMRQKFYFLLLSIGLMVTFSGFDIILKKTANKIEMFTYNGSSWYLIFLTTSLVFPINWLVAKAILALQNAKPPLKADQTGRWWYIGCALFNSFVVFYSFLLIGLSYVMVTNILNSAGPLVVMLLVKTLNVGTHSLLRYLTVVPLVIGVALSYPEDVFGEWDASVPSLLDVFALLYLAMVGASGAFLERIRIRSPDAPSPIQMMASINGWSAICVTLLLACFHGYDFLHFIPGNPEFLVQLSLLATISIFNQIFMYTMILKFGALSCVMTTTACRVITMYVGSPYIVERQELQWLGLGITFAALAIDGAFVPMS